MNKENGWTKSNWFLFNHLLKQIAVSKKNWKFRKKLKWAVEEQVRNKMYAGYNKMTKSLVGPIYNIGQDIVDKSTKLSNIGILITIMLNC